MIYIKNNYNKDFPLVDACVILDSIFSGRPRHTDSKNLMLQLKSRGLGLHIPAHAYFKYSSALISHFKKRDGIVDSFVPGLEIPLVVIPIHHECTDDIIKSALKDRPFPDLKSADLIYCLYADYFGLTLVTEDNRLLRITKKYTGRAYSIQEYLQSNVQ